MFDESIQSYILGSVGFKLAEFMVDIVNVDLRCETSFSYSVFDLFFNKMKSIVAALLGNNSVSFTKSYSYGVIREYFNADLPDMCDFRKNADLLDYLSEVEFGFSENLEVIANAIESIATIDFSSCAKFSDFVAQIEKSQEFVFS